MSLLPRWRPRGGKEILSTHFSPSQLLLSHYHYHNHYYHYHYLKKAIHKEVPFLLTMLHVLMGVFGIWIFLYRKGRIHFVKSIV